MEFVDVQFTESASRGPDTIKLSCDVTVGRPHVDFTYMRLLKDDSIVVIDPEDIYPERSHVGSEEFQKALASIDRADALWIDEATNPSAWNRLSLSEQISAAKYLRWMGYNPIWLDAQAINGDLSEDALHIAFQQTIEAMQSGDLLATSKALKEFDAFAEPDSFEQLLFRAHEALLHQKRHIAIDAFTQIAQSDLNHVHSRLWLGRLAFEVNDIARAGTLFEMASTIAPHDFQPVYAFTELMVQGQQPVEAINKLSDYIERFPEHRNAHIRRITIALELNALDLAEAYIEEMRMRLPGDQSIPIFLLQRSVLARDFKLTEELLEKIKPDDLEDSALKIYLHVSAQLEANRNGLNDVALRYFVDAYKILPGDTNFGIGLVEALLNLGRDDMLEEVIDDMRGVNVPINEDLHLAALLKRHQKEEFYQERKAIIVATAADTEIESDVDDALAQIETH